MGHHGGLWKVGRPGSDSVRRWSGIVGTAGSAWHGVGAALPALDYPPRLIGRAACTESLRARSTPRGVIES